MSTRLATDAEVAAWRDDGWVLVEGLVPDSTIDEAVADLTHVFPSPEEYHADPDGARERWIGRAPSKPPAWTWPDEGPGFRPAQHRWRSEFPFSGSGALNRLVVHPAIVDFAERALGSADLRIYQAHVAAKFQGETNYEQPMHTDRNHSWLPPIDRAPWRQLQTFLYLTDVDDGTAPTHVVPRAGSLGRDPTVPLFMPAQDPDLYAAEQPARGRRGSLLAYRADVLHRGVDITRPGSARFLLNVALRRAGHDWIGFSGLQARANTLEWDAFVADTTPRELALFGFPEPGHPVWDAELLDATGRRYPGLDLAPWREALGDQTSPSR